MVIQLNNQVLRAAIERQGWTPEGGRLHLFGIRGAMPEGPAAVKLTENRPNLYNDVIGVFGTQFELFRGSVDPGEYYTRNPSNANGAAHLVPGMWLYQRGLHRGRPALIQAAAVTVRRDRNRDGHQQAGEPLDTGWFGLNIHAGGAQVEVGSWSAGCQVVWGGWDGEQWKRFLGLVEAARQQLFRYYLLNGKDLVR